MPAWKAWSAGSARSAWKKSGGDEAGPKLHQVMRDNGLELRARGNGLVIEAGGGTSAKGQHPGPRPVQVGAGSARLGSFEAAPERREAQANSYRKIPYTCGSTTESFTPGTGRTEDLDRSQGRGAGQRPDSRRIGQTKTPRKAAAKRAAIKADRWPADQKLLYAQVRASLVADLDAIHKTTRPKRAKQYQGFQRQPWADWLKPGRKKATPGAGCLAPGTQPRASRVTPSRARPARDRGDAPVIDNITKKGTIIYRVGRSAVRDDGDRLQVSREADRDGVQAALCMAMEKYGERITVTGSPEFKAQIIGRPPMPSFRLPLPIQAWSAAAGR